MRSEKIISAWRSDSLDSGLLVVIGARSIQGCNELATTSCMKVADPKEGSYNADVGKTKGS
jgi:hypothetical protein